MGMNGSGGEMVGLSKLEVIQRRRVLNHVVPLVISSLVRTPLEKHRATYLTSSGVKKHGKIGKVETTDQGQDPKFESQS